MIEVKLLGVPQLLARLRKVTDAHDLKLAFGAVGRELVKLEKKRIASQQQLDGSRFPERKSRKGRPEMIANILGRKGKRRQVKMKVSHNGVVIEAFNPLAKAIHHGTPQYKRLKTPAQIRQLTPGIPSHKRACTDEQAKAIKHQIGLSKTIQGIKAMFNELQAEQMLIRHYQKHGGTKKINRPQLDVLGIRPAYAVPLVEIINKRIKKALR